MRTGIYGGTFNPIHSGHLNILREFYSRLKLDRVIVIPTYTPPHKSAKDLASAKDRYNMCVLGTLELDFPAEVSKIEVDRKERSYTADTILEMRRLYPLDEFYLLMGEDMFLTVDRWYKPEVIFENVTVCGTVRGDRGTRRMREYAEKIKKRFESFNYIIEDIPFMDISSTDIRQGSSSLLPTGVLEYIKRKGLYSHAKA